MSLLVGWVGMGTTRVPVSIQRVCLGRIRIYSLVPLFQSESWCTAFHMKMIFHSHGDKTHFHMKGCAPGLASKTRYKTNSEMVYSPLGLIGSSWEDTVDCSEQNVGKNVMLAHI